MCSCKMEFDDTICYLIQEGNGIFVQDEAY